MSKSKFPGWRTMTASERYNARMHNMFETARGLQRKEADARLIAAAPELLAALKDVREAYQKMFSVMPVAWQTYDDIVSAAIAKAEGNAP